MLSRFKVIIHIVVDQIVEGLEAWEATRLWHTGPGGSSVPNFRPEDSIVRMKFVFPCENNAHTISV
jgi:hypothetical protein